MSLQTRLKQLQRAFQPVIAAPPWDVMIAAHNRQGKAAAAQLAALIAGEPVPALTDQARADERIIAAADDAERRRRRMTVAEWEEEQHAEGERALEYLRAKLGGHDPEDAE